MKVACAHGLKTSPQAPPEYFSTSRDTGPQEQRNSDSDELLYLMPKPMSQLVFECYQPNEQLLGMPVRNAGIGFNVRMSIKDFN